MQIEQLTKSNIKQLEQVEEGSNFIFYDNSILDYRKIMIVRADDGGIAGVLCYVEKSGVYEGYMGIGYLEVIEKYRNRGVAKTLMFAMFEEARKLGRGIRTGSYSSDGLNYLKHTIEKLNTQFPDIDVKHH